MALTMRARPAALILMLVAAGTQGADAEPRPLGTGNAASTDLVHPVATEAAADVDAHGARTSVEDFLARFSGTWKGKGFVISDAGKPQRRVACTAVGVTGETTVDVTGDCRALAIFKRAIGVRLFANQGILSGVYTGSRIGDAKLVGEVEDDTLVMTMEWPEPVNGDTTAWMEITNEGNGKLELKVVDKFDGEDTDSETFVSTALTLERSADQ